MRSALAGLTVGDVSQLSFFSAESVPPAVADLTGVLAARARSCCGRRIGARLSVVVDRLWRAVALAEMISEAGLQPEITRTDEDTPLVRTAVDAAAASRSPANGPAGAVKTVPPQWLPGPAGTAGVDAGGGRPEADRYLLGLDPHAPDTHSPLASALMRVGIAPTLIGTRGARSGAADQWPPQAIAPGRERRGTTWQQPRRCRSGRMFSGTSTGS